MKRISYDEMLELASLGAGVMHSRSIEFAKKFNVPIHVRSSFSDVPGTMIVSIPESLKQPVSGAALAKDEARITIEGVPDRPGVSHAIFSRIAKRNIAVDMIVQNVGAEGKADISFTVPRGDVPATMEAAQEAATEIGAARVSHDDDVAKISVVGLGMARQTGVAQKMFNALGEAGVNIETITTSEIKISVLVARDQALAALRAVHSAFGLQAEPTNGKSDDTGAHPAESSALDVVRQLQGMEDLTIDEISLDEEASPSVDRRHARSPRHRRRAVSMKSPAAGIFVDMIVQSYSRAGKANLTFTVPEADLARSTAIAEKVAKQFGCGAVNSFAQDR